MINFALVINLGIIASALLMGAFLRNKIHLFASYLIPAPIIGGFILLFIYNFLAPLINVSSDVLGDLVYHMLNISFIAMMLRTKDKDFVNKKENNVFENVFATMNQYGLQTFLGLLLTYILIKTISPTLSPSFGYMLPLGFELGPGQAYSMAFGWEKLGFIGAPSIALAIAASGYLVGSIGGVILINKGIKKGLIDDPEETTDPESKINSGLIEYFNLDSLTFHAAIIAITYLISYLTLSLLSFLLSFLGPIGVQFGESLWGINFIFSSMIAILMRKLIGILKLKDSIETQMCNRIAGISIDLTIASSLGAISLVALKGYYLEIVLIVGLGIFISCYLLPRYCKVIFSDNWFKRMLIIFGCATGTLSTGLALLRVLEPSFDSSVTTDYLYASALIFPIMIPLILCANLPALSVSQNNPMLFFLCMAIALLYLVVSMIFFFKKKKKKSLANFLEPSLSEN